MNGCECGLSALSGLVATEFAALMIIEAAGGEGICEIWCPISGDNNL
jgi:hypothetical protein